MNPIPTYFNWTPADENSVVQLTAITGDPGHLWPYPSTALPLNILEGFPNEVRDCYISGYLEPKDVQGSVEAIGEFLVTRDHDVPESGKAYVYLIAVDEDSTPFFRGPYKPYPQHYYNQQEGIPVSELFGRIDLNDLDTRKV